MRKMLLLVTLMTATTVVAVDRQQLMPLIESAAINRESAYVKVRNKIVEYGEDALPLLAEIAVDESLAWKQQLVARICKERIERREEIEKLLAIDWYKHPDFDPMQPPPIIGVEGLIGERIIIPALTEQQLWYYYLEVEWKTTGELGKLNRTPWFPDNWINCCVSAVKDSPERIWLLRVFDEMIETTPPPPRLHWLFTTLMNEQKNDTADVLEKYNRKFPPAPPNPQPQHIANEPDPIAERAAAEALKALQKAQQERAATEN